MNALSALGAIMQLSYVPADIEAATNFWTQSMGVGPFFVVPHVKLSGLRYRGTPADIDFSIRLAYWGDIQIELIEQHNDSDSIYREAAGREGLHHVCIVVDDMAPARALCNQNGMVIAQEGQTSDGGEVIYVDTGGGPGTMVEILKSTAPLNGFFAFARQAAREWDGSAPVRQIG